MWIAPISSEQKISMNNYCFLKFLSLNFVLIIGTYLSSFSAQAQSLTLSASSVTVQEADDYFKDVLQNPRDFNSHCDIGFDNFRYSTKQIENGVYTAVHNGDVGPKLGLLTVPTLGSNFATYHEDCRDMALQENYRVDSSKYKNMSWKMKNSAPSTLAVLWSKTYDYAYHGFDQFDGYKIGSTNVQTEANKWVARSFPLASLAASSYPWSGDITGMTIWPSGSQPVGGSTAIDWIRLYDPSTATNIPISWTSASYSSSNGYVDLYIDTNNSGYDGTVFSRGLGKTSSTNFDSGQVPPGTYYIYGVLYSYSSSAQQVVAYSNYVGPFVVTEKPMMQITAPSRTSGVEYARDEAGNAWDMNDQADIVNLVYSDGSPTPTAWRGLHNWRFENGYFYATSDEDTVRNTVDTQVHFRVKPNAPVDTNYYRYFCFRMQADFHYPRDGDWQGSDDAGGVARFSHTRKGVRANGFGSSEDIEFTERSTHFPDYENGFATYCYDLWNDSGPGTGHETGVTWRQLKFSDVMRFDPMEAHYETDFIIDWAALYAENSDSLDRFYDIKWKLSDSDSSNFSVGLYYDNNKNGFDGTLITNLNNQSSGEGSYHWDTASVPAGKYYIYSLVTDSYGNVGKYYSDVQVEVSSAERYSKRKGTPCDFDGDGKTDFNVVKFNSSTGASYIDTFYTSTGGSSTHTNANAKLDLFVPGDFDGDLIADPGLIRVKGIPNTLWQHYVSTTTLTEQVRLGTQGQLPLLADFDGDGITDRTIYNQAAGRWTSNRSSAGQLEITLGNITSIPVPADYDGDRIDDYAVFNRENGNWEVLLSSQNFNSDNRLSKNWSANDAYPMNGDYDGDHKADLVVYSKADYKWRICSSLTSWDCSQGTEVSFGQNGDEPVIGDFDGDGIFDFAVYRPSSGGWHYRQSSNSQEDYKQYGTSADIPLCLSSYGEIKKLEEGSSVNDKNKKKVKKKKVKKAKKAKKSKSRKKK